MVIERADSRRRACAYCRVSGRLGVREWVAVCVQLIGGSRLWIGGEVRRGNYPKSNPSHQHLC